MILTGILLSSFLHVLLATWRNGDIRVKAGESFDLHCEISEDMFTSAFIVKEIGHNKTITVLDTNAKAGRYFGHFIKMGSKINKIKSRVKEATVVDNGTYQCRTMNNYVIESSSSIHVYVQPIITYFKLVKIDEDGKYTELEDNALIKLNDNEKAGFACIAKTDSLKDSYVDVRLSIDRVEIEKVLTREVSERKGKDYMSYNKLTTEAKYFCDSHSGTMNNKQLSCSATMNGLTQTLTADIQVMYPPLIKCEKNSVEAVQGTDMYFICRVTSNPSAAIQWVNTAGKSLGKDHHSRYIYKSKTIDDDIVEVSLKIGEISREELTSRYSLEASNDLGTASRTLVITKLVKTPTYRSVKDKNSASNICVNAALFSGVLLASSYIIL